MRGLVRQAGRALSGRRPSISSAHHASPSSSWIRNRAFAIGKPPRVMIFEIVDDPATLEHVLRLRIKEGHSARLVAAYGRPWKTKKARDPHALQPDERDFDIHFKRDGVMHRWSKIWNSGGGEDYTL